MYRLPGPITIASALFIEFKTSSNGSTFFGSKWTLSIELFWSLTSLGIVDSPFTKFPFFKFATKVISSKVTGKTLPVIANISLILYTAVSKFPYRPFIAAINKFPKLCPLRAPSVNLYFITSSIVGSILANASKQFLISPGGNIPKSSLRIPEPPPSSATVTTAVMLGV